MIYFFSKKISYTKKVLYSGLSLLLISAISITLVGYASQGEVLPWLIVALTGGCSLITLSAMDIFFKKEIVKSSTSYFIANIVFIPLAWIVLLFIGFLLLSTDKLAQEIVIFNIPKIIIINLPVVLLLGIRFKENAKLERS